MDISIIQLLWNPFQGLVDWFKGIFDGLLGSFFSIFTTPIAFLLYSLQVGFFMIIDCIQQVFRSIAGLEGGEYWRNGVKKEEEDIVYDMLYNKTVWDVFLAVLFVSIILVFIVSIVAILRQEFTEQGAGNSKTKIIGRAIKSLVYFAVVPIVCIMGIFISNVFLQTFDKATRRGAVRLSTQVFAAASTEANRARINEDIAKNMFEDGKLVRALFYKDDETAADGNSKDVRWTYFENNIKSVTVTNGEDSYDIVRGANQSTNDFVADIIDAAFRLNAFGNNRAGDGNEVHINTNWQSYEFCAFLLNGFSSDLHNDTFDVRNVQFVHYFYDIFWGYSYIIGFVGGFTAAMLLLSICLGLIQRIYELLILFMISPAFIAFMPMDDGAKYNQWRGQFVSRVGMAYGPVIGMNLMFIVLEVVQTIDIFEPHWNPFNAIMQLIFMIVGLLGVKEFSTMISGLLGQTDALNVGSGKKGDVQKMAGRIAGGSVAAAKTGAAITKATLNTGRSWGDRARANAARNNAADLAQKSVAARKAGDITKANSLMMQARAETDKAKKLDAQADAKYQKGLGGQMNAMIKGDKSDIGKHWGNFLKAAGPDVGYFSRAAIADRAGKGESGLGLMNIWSDQKNGGKTFGETVGKIFTHKGTDLVEAEKNNKKIDDADKAEKAEVARATTQFNTQRGLEQKVNDDLIAKQLGFKALGEVIGVSPKTGEEITKKQYSPDEQKAINEAKNLIQGGTAGSIGTLNVQNLNLDKALVEGDGSSSSAAGGAGGSGGTSTIKTDGAALNVTGDVGLRDGTTVKLDGESFNPLAGKLQEIAKGLGTSLDGVHNAILQQAKEIRGISDQLSGTYGAAPNHNTLPNGRPLR